MCILSKRYNIQSKIENNSDNNNTIELLSIENINNVEDQIDSISRQLIENELNASNPNELYDTIITLLALILLSYFVVNDFIM